MCFILNRSEGIEKFSLSTNIYDVTCSARRYCLNTETFQPEALSLGNLQSVWKVETQRSERSDTPKDVIPVIKGKVKASISTAMSRSGSWRESSQERWKLGRALRDGCFRNSQVLTGTPEEFYHNPSFRDCLCLLQQYFHNFTGSSRRKESCPQHPMQVGLPLAAVFCGWNSVCTVVERGMTKDVVQQKCSFWFLIVSFLFSQLRDWIFSSQNERQNLQT